MGLWVFSFTMMLLTTCAWLVPCEPRPLFAARRSDLTVAFDGSCRICRRVVGLALQLSGGAFVPLGRDHRRRLSGHIGPQGLERMLAVSRDGRARAGGDAFLAMWGRALARPSLEKLARLAPVRAAYSAFARHRHRLGCHSACARPGVAAR